MTPEPNEREPVEPEDLPLSSAELLSTLDLLALLEPEKRMYRYAHVGPVLLEMADEGLVLAVRTRTGLWGRPSLVPSTPRVTFSWSG